MKYSITFEIGTLENFKDAVIYYEKISGELVNQFHQEFWEKIDHIKENPLHYQFRYREIRIAHLKIFPYSIHFIIDKNSIRVLKILHQKQFYN